MQKFVQFVRDMLSEDGVPSSKRCVGWFVMVFAVITVLVSVCIEGMSANNTDLLQMLIGSACLLLGITKVADIFTNNKNGNNEKGSN